MKIKRFVLTVLIFALILAFSAFLTSCKKNGNSESESPSSSETGGSSERENFSDIVNEIGKVSVSAEKGEGYIVKYPSSVEKDEILRFEVEIFENYSKDTAVVSVNGKAVSGKNGIYETRVSGDKAEITVSGVKRTYYSVEYVAAKGVTFKGDGKVAVGGTLGFTVALDKNAVKTNGFKITANGVEISESNGKYTVSNLQSDLQIVAVGVDYPKFSVGITEGEGYEITTDSDEVYKGDDLYVSVKLDDAYALKSNPKVHANGVELEKIGEGLFVLRNVSENVTLTVSGLEKVRSYVVSFENVEEEYAPVEVEFGKTIDIEVKIPEADGRTFVGWSADGEIIPLENFVVTDDTVLEAVWNYNYKDEKSAVTVAHAFTKEEVLKMGEGVPSGRVGYGKGSYQQNADWEAFRIFDDKEGGAFSVTFPKFAFNKYGYTEFKFSTIWSKKTVYYNGTALAPVTNGGNLNNYLEIYVSGGYIGCGSVKIPLKDGVYNGKEPLVLDIDNGKGRHGVFSDFYTFEYDYMKYINEMKKVTETTDKDTARELFTEYKKFKNFLTTYEKTKYSFLEDVAALLKSIAMPVEVSTDGSLVSAKLNGEEKTPNNANETPNGTAASMGASKRWTLTNITEIDLILKTIAISDDEMLVYTMAFQSGSFPYNVSIGGTEVLIANNNLTPITITIHGDGRVTVGDKTVNVFAGSVNGGETLTVKITKSEAWGNMYVSHKVLLDAE